MSEKDISKVDLDAIRDDVPSTDDSNVSQEMRDFEVYAANERLGMERHSAKITGSERLQNIEARRAYARGIFVLLCVWLTVVVATVIGSGHEDCPVKLPDAVLIALISGVSASVVGLFAVVAGYLFPKN